MRTQLVISFNEDAAKYASEVSMIVDFNLRKSLETIQRDQMQWIDQWLPC
jgi:hypothetical protein